MDREPMVIRVSVDSYEPLAGTASAGTGGEVPFEGWLALLGVLSDLVEGPEATDDGPAGGSPESG